MEVEEGRGHTLSKMAEVTRISITGRAREEGRHREPMIGENQDGTLGVERSG